MVIWVVQFGILRAETQLAECPSMASERDHDPRTLRINTAPVTEVAHPRESLDEFIIFLIDKSRSPGDASFCSEAHRKEN